LKSELPIQSVTSPAGGLGRVRFCLAPPGGTARALTKDERLLLDGSTRRAARADFIAGRRAAHALLGPGSEVLRAEDGAPRIVKPKEAARHCLSIAHSGGWGLAAVVEKPGWLIGVDLERRRTLRAALAARVLTPREQSRRGATIPQWTLKEAAIKAIRGSVLELLTDAAAVEVLSYRRSGWCRLRLRGKLPASGMTLTKGDLTLALVIMPPSKPRGSPR